MRRSEPSETQVNIENGYYRASFAGAVVGHAALAAATGGWSLIYTSGKVAHHLFTNSPRHDDFVSEGLQEEAKAMSETYADDDAGYTKSAAQGFLWAGAFREAVGKPFSILGQGVAYGLDTGVVLLNSAGRFATASWPTNADTSRPGNREAFLLWAERNGLETLSADRRQELTQYVDRRRNRYDATPV